MRDSWIEFLESYEIDITTGGGADFAELVLRLINGARWTGAAPSAADVVREMAKARGCSTQPLYMEMKRAIARVWECDAAALRFWEVLPEAQTAPALAAALAERELKRQAAAGVQQPKDRKGGVEVWRKRRKS